MESDIMNEQTNPCDENYRVCYFTAQINHYEVWCERRSLYGKFISNTKVGGGFYSMNEAQDFLEKAGIRKYKIVFL